MIGQLSRVSRFSLRGEIDGGRVGPTPDKTQRHGVDRRVSKVADANRDVHAVLEQPCRAVVIHRVDVDVRIASRIGIDERRDKPLTEQHRSGDRERADRVVLIDRDIRFRVGDRIEQLRDALFANGSVDKFPASEINPEYENTEAKAFGCSIKRVS